MNADMVKLSLILSVYRCPQWFKKFLAVVFIARSLTQ